MRESKPKFKGHKQTDFSDPTEVWKPVDGWPYEVSSKGRVRSLRLLQSEENADGYARVHMYDGTDHIRPSVHRLVAAAFHGPAPDGKSVVAHINGNPRDNRPENVKWSTPIENAVDRKAHGNYRCGPDSPNAKLTDDDARRIRTFFHAEKKNISAISKMFGVSRPTIKRIVSGAGYKNSGGLNQ